MGKLKTCDKLGKTFNRLTIQKVVGRDKHRNFVIEAVCTCGNLYIGSVNKIVSGNTKSCGCLGAEHKLTGTSTHGKCKNPLYKKYRSIKARCLDPKNKEYKNYGGRGINVYPEWISSPAAFINWIENNIGICPSPKHSLDRINNNGNYAPGNLRWATQIEQSANTRKSLDFTFGNCKLTAREISEYFSCTASYVTRLSRTGVLKQFIQDKFI